MPFTIEKIYADLPFAHRQHNHDGHCAFIHGHNWTFIVEFTAHTLDENQFVIDFGKLKWLRAWFDENFDHSLLLNADDPYLGHLKTKLLAPPGMKGCVDTYHLAWVDFAKIKIVPNCGAEGLAIFVFGAVNQMLEQEVPEAVSVRGLRVSKVTVQEDRKNSATYCANE